MNVAGLKTFRESGHVICSSDLTWSELSSLEIFISFVRNCVFHIYQANASASYLQTFGNGTRKTCGAIQWNGVKMKVGSGNDHKDRFFLIISEQIWWLESILP